MNCIHFLFPKCARGKECESIVLHIQHFVFKDCAWKVSKLNNKFGFLWLFYKMQVLQICKHSLHVNICLSWWAVVSCMCFVSDLQENEEKFTLFGLIFPQSINNIYISINCIKPCIFRKQPSLIQLFWLPKINKDRIFQCQPKNAIFYFLWSEITLECKWSIFGG